MHNWRNFNKMFRGGPSTGEVVGIALFSAGFGAALAYFLYGTKKGEEQREKIRDLAHNLKEKVRDYASKTANEIENVGLELYEDTASLLQDKRKQMESLDQMEIKKLADKLRKHWDQIKKDITETLDEEM